MRRLGIFEGGILDPDPPSTTAHAMDGTDCPTPATLRHPRHWASMRAVPGAATDTAPVGPPPRSPAVSALRFSAIPAAGAKLRHVRAASLCQTAMASTLAAVATCSLFYWEKSHRGPVDHDPGVQVAFARSDAHQAYAGPIGAVETTPHRTAAIEAIAHEALARPVSDAAPPGPALAQPAMSATVLAGTLAPATPSFISTPTSPSFTSTQTAPSFTSTQTAPSFTSTQTAPSDADAAPQIARLAAPDPASAPAPAAADSAGVAGAAEPAMKIAAAASSQPEAGDAVAQPQPLVASATPATATPSGAPERQTDTAAPVRRQSSRLAAITALPPRVFRVTAMARLPEVPDETTASAEEPARHHLLRPAMRVPTLSPPRNEPREHSVEHPVEHAMEHPTEHGVRLMATNQAPSLPHWLTMQRASPPRQRLMSEPFHTLTPPGAAPPMTAAAAPQAKPAKTADALMEAQTDAPEAARDDALPALRPPSTYGRPGRWYGGPVYRAYPGYGGYPNPRYQGGSYQGGGYQGGGYRPAYAGPYGNPYGGYYGRPGYGYPYQQPQQDVTIN